LSFSSSTQSVTGDARAVPAVDDGDDRVTASRSVVWVVAAVVVTVGAGLAVSYGLAVDDQVWLFGGAVVFAPVLVASAHGAAGALPDNRRSAGAMAIAGLCIVFIVTIVVSTPWWDEETAATGRSLFVASSDPSAHVYLRRAPGRQELTGPRAPTPLQGGRAYAFTCEVELADSSRWLRLADSPYWAPASAMRTEQGALPAPLRSC
jgi:hypothetical protein